MIRLGSILFFVLFLSPAHALPVHAQSTALRFERISTEQGLSQNTVTSILQDRQGFMWFGTEGGLNRYDGYHFTVYQHDPDNPQSLANNTVFSLFEDRGGTLWVGTAEGLDRFDPHTQTFVHYAYNPNDPTSLEGSFVQAIADDHAGALWVGTEDGGLNQFDPAAGRFTHYHHVANDPGSLSDDTVQAIYEDHDGVLWIGTDAGLDRFDRTTRTFVHYVPPADSNLAAGYSVHSILEHAGALWLGTLTGLVDLDRGTGHFAAHRHDPANATSVGSDSVGFLYQDRDGALWLGTRTGLDQFAQGRFVHYRYDANDLHSLSSDYVRAVYQDPSGVLWVGTAGGGLSKYSPAGQKFGLYQALPGQRGSLSDNNVWAVHADHDGVLWIGTFFSGLNALDRGSGGVTVYRHDPNKSGSLGSDEVRVITDDSIGNLWIGMEHGGLDRLDRQTGSFVHYRHDPANPQSLSDDDVFAIFEDREHRLWIGTQNGGLNRLNPADGTFVHYRHDANDPSGLSHNHVESIYQDTQGVLWIATLGGLDRWDSAADRFIHYRNDPQNSSTLGSDLVTSVLQDSGGAYWIGTYGGGLNRLDRAGQVFTHYTTKNGLPDDTVYGMLADAQGFLWLSTNAGISRFDPRTATFRNYTTNDGLQGSQFNARAYFQSPAGEMFFGGGHGLNFFYPDQVRDNSFVPPVVLTLFMIQNRPAALDAAADQPIQLSYLDNVISFEFAALDYNAPAMNQYAYRLDGVDPDWVLAGTRRYAGYTNLAGGDYVFRVKASNSDGVWGPAELALKVQVTPPIWETGWFRGSALLALALAAFGGYRMRMQGLQARRRELETQVARRTRELATLNGIASVVSRSLDLKSVLNDALERTMQVMEMEVGSALVLEGTSPDLILMAHRGVLDPLVKLGERWPLASALVGRPLDGSSPLAWNVAADYADGALKTRLLREGIQLVVGVPLTAKEKTVGMLVLSTRTSRALTAEESALLSAVGQQVGVAVENARLYEQAQQVAATAERSRLARELHDSVTQSLYSVMLFAEAAARSLNASELGEAGDYLSELRDTAQDALREMRLLIFELRPPALEKNGLAGALRVRLNAVEGRGGMKTELRVEDDARLDGLPFSMQEELYHIAQEALNNVIRHAHAKSVQVEIAFRGDAIHLQVSDDGIGFESARADESSGLGLRGMRERVQRVGGALQIESGTDLGTSVKVQVPLPVDRSSPGAAI